LNGLRSYPPKFARLRPIGWMRVIYAHLMKKSDDLPTTNASEIEALIKRIESNQLSEGDKQLAARLLKLALELLRMEKTSVLPFHD
jgi:hypothetical protein